MKKLKNWFVDNVGTIHVIRYLVVTVLLCSLFLSSVFIVNAESNSSPPFSIYPMRVDFTNVKNIPYEDFSFYGTSNGEIISSTIFQPQIVTEPTFVVELSYLDDGRLNMNAVGQGFSLNFDNHSGFEEGLYYLAFQFEYGSNVNSFICPTYSQASATAVLGDGLISLYYNTSTLFYIEDTGATKTMQVGLVLTPYSSDSSGECPSLQTQINQFTGTYDEFEGLLLGSVNETIYQGYRNKLQEMFRDGVESVTLEQLLADYDGSFQQLITLLSENNLRLLDEYSDYVEEQRTLSYNDGYAQGNEDGFNDGYNRGYNKGSSEVFGETLLGDTFNMPLNALNNWVLFETSTGLEVTMGGLFTAVIALAVLVIFLKMFAGG